MPPSPSAIETSAPVVGEETHGLGMTLPVAEDDGLEERSPAQPVDVVDLDLGLEQAPDDLDVPAMSGANEASAVVAVSPCGESRRCADGIHAPPDELSLRRFERRLAGGRLQRLEVATADEEDRGSGGDAV